MPTSNEFAELCNSAYTEYIDASGNVISGTDKRTTYNGVVGLLIRSKANGNVLFLPTAGNYEGASLVNKGISGGYWSMSYYSMSNAYRLNFSPGGIFPQDHYGYRYFGFPVRAVQDGTPNRSIIPPIPEDDPKDKETPTGKEPKDDNQR